MWSIREGSLQPCGAIVAGRGYGTRKNKGLGEGRVKKQGWDFFLGKRGVRERRFGGGGGEARGKAWCRGVGKDVELHQLNGESLRRAFPPPHPLLARARRRAPASERAGGQAHAQCAHYAPEP